MTLRRLAVVLFLVLGIVLSPLRASAATVPMFVAPIVAVERSATTQLATPDSAWCEGERPGINAYEAALLGYDGPSNLHVTAGAGAVSANGGGFKLTDRRALRGEGAIYAAPAPVPAAEGITEGTSVLANAARAAENLSASDEAIAHVLERHAFGSPAANAGKFAADADISTLIKSAVSNGVIRPGNATNPSAFVFEQLFSSPVGVTRAGADALGVRVVLDPSGALITAFPF